MIAKLVILMSLILSAALWWKLIRERQRNTALFAEVTRLRSQLRAKRS